MARVEATYILVDRISRNADKIQKKLEKMEATMASIDKQTSDLGKNKGFDQFASRASKSADRVNQRLDTLQKRLGTTNQRLETTARRADTFGGSLDKVNSKLVDQNKNLATLSSWHKQGASDIAVHAKQQRDLNQSMVPVNRKLDQQRGLMDSHARTALAMQHGLDKLTLKEHKLGDAWRARTFTHVRRSSTSVISTDRPTVPLEARAATTGI